MSEERLAEIIMNWYENVSDESLEIIDELLEEYKEMHPEDQEWFQEIADNINRSDELLDLEEEE